MKKLQFIMIIVVTSMFLICSVLCCAGFFDKILYSVEYIDKNPEINEIDKIITPQVSSKQTWQRRSLDNIQRDLIYGQEIRKANYNSYSEDDDTNAKIYSGLKSSPIGRYSFRQEDKSKTGVEGIKSDLEKYLISKYSPINSGIKIGYTLNQNVNAVKVEIGDEKGAIIRSAYYNKPFLKGNYVLSWDGKDKSGRQLEDGDYFINVKGTTNNILDGFDIRPKRKNDEYKFITVKGVKYLDSYAHIIFGLSRTVRGMKTSIYDEKGDLVKTLYENDEGLLPVGNYSLDWDLTDEDGNPVPEGNYEFRATSMMIPSENDDEPKVTAHRNYNRYFDGPSLGSSFHHGESSLVTYYGGDVDMSKIPVIITHGANDTPDGMQHLMDKYDPEIYQIFVFDYNDLQSMPITAEEFGDSVNALMEYYPEGTNIIFEQHSQGCAIVYYAISNGCIDTNNMGEVIMFSESPLFGPVNYGPDGAEIPYPIDDWVPDASEEANGNKDFFEHFGESLPDKVKHYVIVTAPVGGDDGTLRYDQMVNDNVDVDGFIMIEDDHAAIRNNAYLNVVGKILLNSGDNIENFTIGDIQVGEDAQGNPVCKPLLDAKSIVDYAIEGGYFGPGEEIELSNGECLMVYDDGVYVFTINGEEMIGVLPNYTGEESVEELAEMLQDELDPEEDGIGWDDIAKNVNVNGSIEIDDNNNIIYDLNTNDGSVGGGLGWETHNDDGESAGVSANYSTNGGESSTWLTVSVGKNWKVSDEDVISVSINYNLGDVSGLGASASYAGHEDWYSGDLGQVDFDYGANISYSEGSGCHWDAGVHITADDDLFGEIDDLPNGDKGIGFHLGLSFDRGIYGGTTYETESDGTYVPSVGYNSGWNFGVEVRDHPDGRNWSISIGNNGIKIKNGHYALWDGISLKTLQVSGNSIVATNQVAEHYIHELADEVGLGEVADFANDTAVKPTNDYIYHTSNILFNRDEWFGLKSDPKDILLCDPSIGGSYFLWENNKDKIEGLLDESLDVIEKTIPTNLIPFSSSGSGSASNVGDFISKSLNPLGGMFGSGSSSNKAENPEKFKEAAPYLVVGPIFVIH